MMMMGNRDRDTLKITQNLQLEKFVLPHVHGIGLVSRVFFLPKEDIQLNYFKGAQSFSTPYHADKNVEA